MSVCAAAVLLRAWWVVYTDFVSPAWFDIWLWVDDFRLWTDGRFTFHDLVKPHYEHRIATTRVLMLADSVAFGMGGRLEIVATLVCLGVSGLLIGRLAASGRQAPDRVAVPKVFWVAWFTSLCQTDNLLLPFQVQFPIVCVCACGAAMLLAGATASAAMSAAWRAAGAGVLVIAADFSMGSGVLLTPALMLLLLLRRARPLVWLIFVPLAGLGLVLFFHHYGMAGDPPRPPLLDAHLAMERLLYTGNFLASSLGAFPDRAAFFGLAGVVLLVCLMAWLVARPGAARVSPADAALIALAGFVALCGPAGTLTARLLFGPQAALASRYATMSLLFTAALFALCLRLLPARATRFAGPGVAAAGLFFLAVFNLPFHARSAANMRRAITEDAQFLINDVAVQGPAPVIFAGGIDDIRDRVAFLHSHRLNMFAPGNGPPADLLRQLARPLGDVGVCIGAVDDAYAIDETGFLLRGWVAHPDGKHGAPWIAVLDDAGHLLGTVRSLDPRPDLPEALGRSPMGFESGFRLRQPRPDASLPVGVRIVGLFPGEAAPICVLPGSATLSPALIAPVAELKGGWAPLERTDQRRFHLDAPGDQGLVVPFAMGDPVPDAGMAFRFADGASLEVRLPSLFGRSDWRAVVLPAAFMARHAGAVDITVRGGVAVAAPRGGGLRFEWSRIF